MTRKTVFTLFFLMGSLLSASCKPVQTSPTSTPTIAPTETAMLAQPVDVVVHEPYDYCFAYPQGYTRQAYHDQVEVYAPQSGVGGLVGGIVWIDFTDAQGRTAQEIADEEVNAIGVNPPRFTVMLGGEEALVLNGVPGQDLIRKVYIVHNGSLYTLSFAPHQSANETANAQMEALYKLVISSWVWMSSGMPCPVSG